MTAAVLEAPPVSARPAEIVRVLQSGASDDGREIRRNIAGACPSIETSDVQEACNGLVAAGKVPRHVLPSRCEIPVYRYQLRARWS